VDIGRIYGSDAFNRGRRNVRGGGDAGETNGTKLGSVPELPEVETIRQELEPALVGKTIRSAEIRDQRLTRPDTAELLSGALRGEVVAGLGRRGKYLLLGFESGRTLVIHLRMTGSFSYRRRGDITISHERARLVLDDGGELVYRDVRRFGTWQLLEPRELEEYLSARVGPEPLASDFTPGLLAGRLAGDREIYEYLRSSSEGFLTPAGLLECVRSSGFQPLASTTRMGGLVSIIVATPDLRA